MLMPNGELQGESSVTFRSRLHPPANNINTIYDDNLMIRGCFGLPVTEDITSDLTRRRRSSITVAVLQRRPAADSYVLDQNSREADRYSAILGFFMPRPRNQINISASQNIQIGPTYVYPELPNSTGKQSTKVIRGKSIREFVNGCF